MITLTLLFAMQASPAPTPPAPTPPADTLKSETIDYKHGDVALQGIIYWDESVKGKRPGVIVVHEWKGLGDYAKMRAKMVARLGYVAFAVDMYGKGVYAKDHDEAGKLAGVFFKDRELMRGRAAAALDVLKKHELCDGRIAAMGYCFGGTTALEMARANMDVLGVASFHGNLTAPQPAKSIKAKIQVYHGADDKFVNPAVEGFEKEMREANADYVLVKFPGAVHSFTVKEAGDDATKGMAYNADADAKSWELLKAFLADLFKK